MGNRGTSLGLDKSGRLRGLYKREGKRRSLDLEELYERHGESLYRYLVFKLGAAEDAEDVLQESFCRFARYDLRWRLVRDPRAFVFRVARNEANRFLKRKLGRREGERMIATGGDGTRSPRRSPGPNEPAAALLLRQGRGASGGAEGSRLSEGVRRPDLQGDRRGLRRVREHGGQPLPLRDREAARGRGSQAVKTDRRGDRGRDVFEAGAAGVERELRRLVPAAVPPGLRGRVVARAAEARRGALLAPWMRVAATVCSLLIVAALGVRHDRRQARRRTG